MDHLLAWVAIALAAISMIAAWIAMITVWPYVACTHCNGSGRRVAPVGPGWRECPRCGGTGRRRRAGRWLLDQLRAGRD